MKGVRIAVLENEKKFFETILEKIFFMPKIRFGNKRIVRAVRKQTPTEH